jgi:hypothetical protein
MPSILKKVLAILAGFALALLVGELMSPAVTGRRAADKTVYVTDGRGFRLGEHALAKPAGTVRIAFIGDSYTFGRGVEASRIFSERTAALLEAKLPGRAVETLNFGHPGFNSLRELDALKNVALAYEPDIIVLAFVLNDFSAPAETVRFEEELKDLRDRYSPLKALHRHSRLAAFLDWSAYQIFSGVGRVHLDYLDGLFDPARNRDLPQQRAALEEMVRVIGERGGVVLFLPYFVRDEPEQEFYIKGKALVEGLCLASGVPFVEVLPLLASKPYYRWWASRLDHHPNAEAHDIIAKALVDVILDEGML